jgi:hypothetical protein
LDFNKGSQNIMSNSTDGSPEEGAKSPEVSTELKAMVKSGNAVLSNPKSVGYGIQQIKLENWDPEDEEYWEVSNVACGGIDFILYSPLIESFLSLIVGRRKTHCHKKPHCQYSKSFVCIWSLACVVGDYIQDPASSR